MLRAKSNHSPEAMPALAELCSIYWRPVYAFLRRQGNSPHDAEDLTQGFFAALLERGSLASVEAAKGKLRSFLLVAVKRFAANQYEHDHALKRGGAQLPLSLDWLEAEERYRLEPATQESPDWLFERQWALALLDQVLEQLRKDYGRDGRETVFEALKNRITVDGDPDTFATVAEGLGMTAGALRVALCRLRQRYSQLLHEEIARTVESPSEVREEIAHLLRVFSSPG